jgi:Tol biopolymer transport system component
VWSPDGLRIAFASTREGAVNLYVKDASGAGEDKLLLKTDTNKFPTSWSLDGRRLLYHEYGQNTRADLRVLAVDTRQATLWLGAEFDERNGQFSADGQWVAYDSDESGRHDVYVRPFSPDGASGVGRWLISTGGGERPRWRADGKELFFLAPDRRLMAVEIRISDGRVEAGLPKPLFPTTIASAYTAYAVTGDGQRFLIITERGEAVSQPVIVVVNWTAGLKR